MREGLTERQLRAIKQRSEAAMPESGSHPLPAVMRSMRDVPVLVTEVERLQREVRHLKFKQWYYSSRLNAWASWAMAQDDLIKEINTSIPEGIKLRLQRKEEKFRKACEVVNERVKAYTQKQKERES